MGLLFKLIFFPLRLAMFLITLPAKLAMLLTLTSMVAVIVVLVWLAFRFDLVG